MPNRSDFSTAPEMATPEEILQRAVKFCESNRLRIPAAEASGEVMAAWIEQVAEHARRHPELSGASELIDAADEEEEE